LAELFMICLYRFASPRHARLRVLPRLSSAEMWKKRETMPWLTAASLVRRLRRML
jgi:hypothetical protein